MHDTRSSTRDGPPGQSAADSSALTGSLTHPADDKAEGRLQALLSRRPGEALVVLRKWLREAVRAEAEATAPNLRFKAGPPAASRIREAAEAASCLNNVISLCCWAFVGYEGAAEIVRCTECCF